MATKIALVDIDNFYASCERLFNPNLMKAPLAILSNNDGCVIARCNLCRQLGIDIGFPAFERKQAERDFGVRMLSANFPLYEDLSQRTHRIMRSLGHPMEIYSIDEAFIDFSGLDHVSAASEAHLLYSKVRQWLGLPVSIGIAPNKTLAKVAGKLAKKVARQRRLSIDNLPTTKNDGLPIASLASEQEIDQALAGLALDDIWGIGGRLATRLIQVGIQTPRQLRDADPRTLYKNLRIDMRQMICHLRGEHDADALELVSPVRQRILNSRTFGRHLTQLHDVAQAVAVFTSLGAEKLRSDRTLAQKMTLYLQPAVTAERYTPHLELSCHLEPSDDTAMLVTLALDMLHELWQQASHSPGHSSGHPANHQPQKYRRAGVALQAVPRSDQVSLFGALKSSKRRQLFQATDAINQRFGRETVKLAVAAGSQQWRSKQRLLSDSFSTDWDGLLEADTDLLVPK